MSGTMYCTTANTDEGPERLQAIEWQPNPGFTTESHLILFPLHVGHTMAHAPTPLSAGPGLVIDDLLQLPRPSSAIVSPTRTHALWPSSTFSFSAADGKGRTDKSVYLVSNLDDPALPPADATATTSSDSVTTNRSPAPRKLLSSLAYLEFTWLDSRTFLFLRPSLPTEVVAAKDERGRRVDHPLNVSDAEHAKRRSAHAALEGGQGVELWAFDVLTEEEYQVGSFPVV